MVVVEPPGKAFDAACRLRPRGHFRGDVGQLRALAAHDAADERRQGVEVAGAGTCRLRRSGGREGVADGMRAAKGVTHRPCLLCSIAGGGYDEPTFKPGPAKNNIRSIDSIYEVKTSTLEKCLVVKTAIRTHEGIMLDSFLAAQAAHLSRHPRGAAIHGWAVCAARRAGGSVLS